MHFIVVSKFINCVRLSACYSRCVIQRSIMAIISLSLLLLLGLVSTSHTHTHNTHLWNSIAPKNSVSLFEAEIDYSRNLWIRVLYPLSQTVSASHQCELCVYVSVCAPYIFLWSQEAQTFSGCIIWISMESHTHTNTLIENAKEHQKGVKCTHNSSQHVVQHNNNTLHSHSQDRKKNKNKCQTTHFH